MIPNTEILFKYRKMNDATSLAIDKFAAYMRCEEKRNNSSKQTLVQLKSRCFLKTDKPAYRVKQVSAVVDFFKF